MNLIPFSQNYTSLTLYTKIPVTLALTLYTKIPVTLAPLLFQKEA